MKRAVLAVAGTLALIVACASPTRADAVHSRSSELRDALAGAVADPGRRDELMACIDAMESTMLATIHRGTELNEEFVAAGSDPAADADQLTAIAARLAVARRDGMRRFLEARLELRRKMSPQEWTAFTHALPEFDGGSL